MAKTTEYTIKKVNVLSIVKVFALFGFVWGFLAGLIFLASYIQGFMTNGDAALIQSGLLGLCEMVLYGIIGGVIGGAVVACLYNRILGAKHGIRMELDLKV
jgi:hypothetical protein